MTNTAEVYQFPDREARHASRGPQLEDGYTRTVNALVEAFARAPLTSREARVVRVVERMTYGWNKAEDWIAASVISDMTGMSEGKCSETLNALIRKKVLTRSGGSRSPIRINKVVSEWNFTAQKSRVTPKQNVKSTWGRSPQNGVSERPQDGVTPKDRKDIEPIGSKSSSKKSSPKKWGDAIDHELAELMFERVTEGLTNPKRPNMNAWANDMRLLRTSDKRTEEQIRYLINWVSRDEFWSSVVMCPAKLRKQWDPLEKKVVAYKESRHANRHGSDTQRTERDRIAARLADPHDSDWIDGLFDEEGTASGTGEPGVYEAGSDLSPDMANVIHNGSDVEAGEARGRCFDGEVAGAADDSFAGHGAGADQGRGRRMATERREADQELAAEAGGFWHA